MKSLGTFYSGFIEIQTFDGPKWIKDIKVGDLVLTNQQKYKKIVKITVEAKTISETYTFSS